METKLMRKAVELWSSPYVSREQNRYNQRQWLKSVMRLGSNWAVLIKSEKLDNPRK